MPTDTIKTAALVTDPTAPQFLNSFVSPEGNIIDIYRTPAYHTLTLLRYDPAKGETRERAWLNGGCETALLAGIAICGNAVFTPGDKTSAYTLIGRLVVQDGWTRIDLDLD